MKLVELECLPLLIVTPISSVIWIQGDPVHINLCFSEKNKTKQKSLCTIRKVKNMPMLTILHTTKLTTSIMGSYERQ